MCQSAFRAGTAQKRMLLQSLTDARVSVFVEYVPALQVGGDYTCIRAVGEDKLYVIVSDVSGHGISSSLVMARVGPEIERLVQAGENVAAIAQALNIVMTAPQAEDEMYLTLFGSEIDFALETISYVNCGHPAQFLWSDKLSSYARLESENLPVGLFGPDKFGTPRTITLDIHPGDKLILFTDGMLELKLEDGSELGERGLISMFRELVEKPSEATKQEIFDRIKAAQTDHLNDDLLFIFIDIKGGSRLRQKEENSLSEPSKATDPNLSRT